MTNDNRTNLKADHGQHSKPQKRKYSNHAFIAYMLLMTALLSLLLIPSCQQAKAVIIIGAINHA